MIAAALERVPDDPWRVDTRGMLLSGRAQVRFASTPESVADGFLVCLPALVSIVGRPPRALIRETLDDLDGDVHVLCEPMDAAYVAAALSGWIRTTAILHALRSRPSWADGFEPDARLFHADNVPSLAHVPPTLRRELMDALRGRTTSRLAPDDVEGPERNVPPPLEPMAIAAAWSGGRPVSFCYPVLRTESWWDISVETLMPYRRQGHAARAVRAMARHMWEGGRAPVWGATVSNVPSLSLAHRLGFQEVGRVCVFMPRPDDG